MEGEAAACLLTAGVFMAFAGLLVYAVRRQAAWMRAVADWQARVREELHPLWMIPNDPYLLYNARYAVESIGAPQQRWWIRQRRVALLAATSDSLFIYPKALEMRTDNVFSWKDLRWFGRPQPYQSGNNTIWLHFEYEGRWSKVSIRLSREKMMEFVRLSKEMAESDLVTAYRRRRPYIHLGPVQASLAQQDIHGAWTLDAPVQLYLMPRFLVILKGGVVSQKFPLESIQTVGALRRLDQPGAEGLVRFRVGEADFHFAVANHEAFAAALAEAAKRTLEAPLERKQKKKEEDEDEEY
jgi:hypothetical protein